MRLFTLLYPSDHAHNTPLSGKFELKAASDTCKIHIKNLSEQHSNADMCKRILRLTISYNRYTVEVQYTTIKFGITYNLMCMHTHV